MRPIPVLGIALATLLLAACSKDDPEATDTEPPPPPPTGGVVTLQTDDGLALQADSYPLDAGAPGIVLLHMVPPNHRGDWPRRFINGLNDAGWAVLNVDRRGAGDSEGNGADAAGPDGRLDADAAVRHMVADGFGPIAIIGASNGTTSMIDYVDWAPGQGRTVPVALGFMTGGGYTEQNGTDMAAMTSLPAVFTYSTAERDWSEDQRGLDPGTWVFHEYAGGDHGTRMFDAAPEVVDDLVAFFADLP